VSRVYAGQEPGECLPLTRGHVRDGCFEVCLVLLAGVLGLEQQDQFGCQVRDAVVGLVDDSCRWPGRAARSGARRPAPLVWRPPRFGRYRPRRRRIRGSSGALRESSRRGSRLRCPRARESARRGTGPAPIPRPRTRDWRSRPVGVSPRPGSSTMTTWRRGLRSRRMTARCRRLAVPCSPQEATSGLNGARARWRLA
jgi:hypothetical protein